MSCAVVVILTLLVPACGGQRKSAETAITRLDATYEVIRAEATSVAPDQARAIEESIASARWRVADGDFKGGMELVRELHPRVKELSDRLPGMRSELETAWQRLQTSLPGTLASVRREVRRSTGSAASASPASAGPASRALHELEGLWGDAETAMKDGRLAEAVSTAEDVRTRLVILAADMHRGS